MSKSAVTKVGRSAINRTVEVCLFARTAGRCEFRDCNRLLVEHHVVQKPGNFAEKAHIVAYSDGGPRAEAGKSAKELNQLENLMLLCPTCHKLIDDHPDIYTVSLLRTYKAEHEERIEHVTGMSRDRATTVIRVFGAIRGAPTELARKDAMQTVIDVAGRYAHFQLAAAGDGIELDLTKLPEPEALPGSACWQSGSHLIQALGKQLTDAVSQGHIQHISIFGLARIPFLVLLGYVVDDKVPADIYQKHRGGNEGWAWPSETDRVAFEIKQLATMNSKDVAVLLSLSGKLTQNDLPEGAQTLAVYEILPHDVEPTPTLVKSKATLDSFAQTFMQLLALLEAANPRVTTLRLFGAIPASAAIECGRHLMKGVHPTVIVYDRIDGVFQETITITPK